MLIKSMFLFPYPKVVLRHLHPPQGCSEVHLKIQHCPRPVYIVLVKTSALFGNSCMQYNSQVQLCLPTNIGVRVERSLDTRAQSSGVHDCV